MTVNLQNVSKLFYPITAQVPSREIDKTDEKFWTMWNKETKQFFLQFAFKVGHHSPIFKL